MTKRQTNPLERFTTRFNRSTPDECWEWTGSRTPSGYGMFWPYGRDGGKQYAHRFSYEHFVGPIPEDHQIDHLCENSWCVNPAHLDPVSGLVNMRRSRGWTQNEAGDWFCSNGHPAGEEAQHICLACRAARLTAYRKRGGAVQGKSEKYHATWSRAMKLDRFAEEHPSLREEAENCGLPMCRARLRANWEYDAEGWIKPDGLRVPFGFGVVTSRRSENRYKGATVQSVST